MARVTIEDCLKQVENNFELVVLASVYAKDISGSLFEKNKPKSHVKALRDIADGKINPSDLRTKLIKVLGNKDMQEAEDFEEEIEEENSIKDAVESLDLLASENVSLDDES